MSKRKCTTHINDNQNIAIKKTTKTFEHKMNSKNKSNIKVKLEPKDDQLSNNENINPKKPKFDEKINQLNVSSDYDIPKSKLNSKQIDIDYKSVFPEFIQHIYLKFINSNYYANSMRTKDEYYSGVGLYGIGIEEKMYKKRRKMEESLKRGFRLRPNPRPTKLFDGTVFNRPKRSDNSMNVNKTSLYASKSYIFRTKNRFNLFNIGKEMHKRKSKPTTRRIIRKKSTKPRNPIIRNKVALSNSNNEESSSDVESSSIALTRPKRQPKMPQLGFKYCYEPIIYGRGKKFSGEDESKPSLSLEIIEENIEKKDLDDIVEETEEERLEDDSVEIVKLERCDKKIKESKILNKLVDDNEVQKIDSDSSSVVEVVPPHEMCEDLSENGISSSDSIDSVSKDLDGVSKKLSCKNSSNKNKKSWRPKNKALNLLDKLRLGLQCTIIQTENDIIIQNLSTEDLSTLQSRIHGLATFKNIEAEYDKNGQESARVTIDRKALNIPLKTYENSPEGKNIGLKRYFDSLKRKVISKNNENLHIERKKPTLSVKPLNIPGGPTKSIEKSSNITNTSSLSSQHHPNSVNKLNDDSSQNWLRSKVRSVKKVRKLYTHSTNTPNILSRSCHQQPQSNKPPNSMTSESRQATTFHSHHSILPLNYPDFRMSTADSNAQSNLIQSSGICSNSTVSNNSISNNAPTTLPNVGFYPKLKSHLSLPTHSTSLSSLIPSLEERKIESATQNPSGLIKITTDLINKSVSKSNEHAVKTIPSLTVEKSTEKSYSNPITNDGSQDDNESVSIISPPQQVTSSASTTIEKTCLEESLQKIPLSNNDTIVQSSFNETHTTTSVTNSTPNVTTSTVIVNNNHTTPATAMSASQLLMMKKSSNTSSSSSAAAVGVTNNENNKSNKHYSHPFYHHQHQHHHQLHHTNSAAFLQQLTANSVGSGSTPDQLITNQILKPFKKQANNMSPAKIEIDDDDNEADFELPANIQQKKPIATVSTEQLLSDNTNNTPTKTTTSINSVNTSPSDSNIAIAKPLIQQSGVNTIQNSPNPVSTQILSPAKIITSIPNDSSHQITTTTTITTTSSSPTNCVKIKHRKLTHNFHNSSNLNIREVLCGTGPSTGASPTSIIKSHIILPPQSNTNRLKQTLTSAPTVITNTPTNTVSTPTKSSNTVLKSLLVGSNTTTTNSKSDHCHTITSSPYTTVINNTMCLINNNKNNTNSIGLNWHPKYLNSLNTSSQDSKIKWQVSGTIHPTHTIEHNSNNDK